MIPGLSGIFLAVQNSCIWWTLRGAMTIQLVPNSFQIHCSQNVREAAKISGAISFPYLESQLVLKYLKESETDKMLFSNIFYQIFSYPIK